MLLLSRELRTYAPRIAPLERALIQSPAITRRFNYTHSEPIRKVIPGISQSVVHDLGIYNEDPSSILRGRSCGCVAVL